MMEEAGGHGNPSRLDRIERAIEGLIDGHEQLTLLHKQLLTAQVVMTDAVNALAKPIETREDRLKALIEGQSRLDEFIAFLKRLLERPPGDLGLANS
jgi:hypothetical protein